MRFFDRFNSLLFASVLSFCMIWGGQTIAQISPTREDLQSELISRMVSVYAGISLGELPHWQGEVPPQVSELPMPDEARIIGSINLVDSYFQIFLDVPRVTDQVQSFYQEQLRNTGWKEDRSFSDIGLNVAIQSLGFPLDSPAIFCKSDQFLLLWTTPMPNAPATTVRLHLGSTTEPGNIFCNSY